MCHTVGASFSAYLFTFKHIYSFVLPEVVIVFAPFIQPFEHLSTLITRVNTQVKDAKDWWKDRWPCVFIKPSTLTDVGGFRKARGSIKLCDLIFRVLVFLLSIFVVYPHSTFSSILSHHPFFSHQSIITPHCVTCDVSRDPLRNCLLTSYHFLLPNQYTVKFVVSGELLWVNLIILFYFLFLFYFFFFLYFNF